MLSVAAAEPADLSAITDLMDEVDRFYGATNVDPAEVRQPQIEAVLFGTPPIAWMLLAKDDGAAVGLAAYSYLWPAAGVTRSLFLKELYVRRTHVRSGVGRLLMRELARVAAATGCSRLEWQTDTFNGDAQQFYEALGAPADNGKIFYRLNEAGIRQLADQR